MIRHLTDLYIQLSGFQVLSLSYDQISMKRRIKNFYVHCDVM